MGKWSTKYAHSVLKNSLRRLWFKSTSVRRFRKRRKPQAEITCDPDYAMPYLLLCLHAPMPILFTSGYCCDPPSNVRCLRKDRYSKSFLYTCAVLNYFECGRYIAVLRPSDSFGFFASFLILSLDR